MPTIGHRVKALVISLAIFFAVGLLIEFYLHQIERSSVDHQIAQDLAEYRSRIEKIINQHVAFAESVKSLRLSNPDLTQQQFSQFIEQLSRSTPLVEVFALSDKWVINKIHPYESNKQVIGLDYQLQANQREAAIKAKNAFSFVLAGPVKLVQGGEGFIGHLPIHDAASEFIGLVSIVINKEELYKEAGFNNLPDLKLAIKGADSAGEQGAVFFGSADVFKREHVATEINLPVGSWVIGAQPRAEIVHSKTHWQAWAIWLIVITIGSWWIQKQQNQNYVLSQLNKKLRRSENRFRNMFERHKTTMLLVSPEDGHIIDANLGAQHFYGYSIEQFKEKNISSLTENLDNSWLSVEFSEKSDGKSCLTQTHVLANGDKKVVEVYAASIDYEDRVLLYFIIHDVSSRIETEKKLKLSATVMENTREGVMITDADNIVIAINSAFFDITGYTEEDIIGQSPKVLGSGKHDQIFYEKMWLDLQLKGHWKGEIWNRTKDGKLYPELLSITKITDEHGVTVNYVAVFSDISQLKQSEERLFNMAHYDALTELPNRFLLKSRLEHGVERARRHKQKLITLFLDLDRFKVVNDSLGHHAGDELLKQVAKRLKKRLRKEDTLARLGGDEFVILLELMDKATDSVQVCNAIIRELQRPFDINEGQDVYIGTSIGISVFPDDAITAEELVDHADTAMYSAKENGRNTYAFYKQDLTLKANKRLILTAQMKQALANDEFILHFQPQIAIRDEQPKAVEALIRWQHPERGLLFPGEFIEIAEETGLIHEISEWVLDKSSYQVKCWLEQGLKIKVALNISAKDLGSGHLSEKLRNVLNKYQIPADYIELEITESMLMENPENVPLEMAELRELGVSLAIDDFGTGYSSLAYLKHFPINQLKIDRSFVKDLPTDKADEAIVLTIIAMAHGLGLETLAEGVETQQQADFLLAHGCEFAQGYLYSKPLPPEEIAVFYLSYEMSLSDAPVE